jgi:glycerophosphoryl diester phosphodiesterase
VTTHAALRALIAFAPMQRSRLDWLTVRPIAHRGLHDAVCGIIENTASAARAAIAGGYGIEVDLQVSADGEAMVYHDDALGRLTDGGGVLRDLTAAALAQVPFKATRDRMMRLGDLLDLVEGRAVLLLELKSRFDGDLRLAKRAAAVLAGYNGPVGVMSFDPDLIAAIRRIAPQLIRGIVMERHYQLPHWDFLSPSRKRALAFLLHGATTRPAFLACRVDDLATFAPRIARLMFGLPLLAWTVRSRKDRAMSVRYADQIIFEGFRA